MYFWDEKKSKANKQKHGISFEEARDFIFEGRNILTTGVAYDKGEARHVLCWDFYGNVFGHTHYLC